MIHHDHILNFAVIRLENKPPFCYKTVHSPEFIERIYLPGTDLNGSTITGVSVLPYSKEVESLYKN